MIDVIPAGQNAVISDDRHYHHDHNVAERVKDELARLRSDMSYGTTESVKASKETEIAVEKAKAAELEATRDAEAEVRDAIRDAEAEELKATKEVEIAVERAKAANLLETEKAKSKLVEEIGETKLVTERANERTKDFLAEEIRDAAFQGHQNTDRLFDRTSKDHMDNMVTNANRFKEQLLEEKQTQFIMQRLAYEADKTACANQAATQLSFKEQALLSTKLACDLEKGSLERYCNMKELVRSEGQATRDLLNRQEIDRLRDRAMRVEAQLAAYFSRGAVPTMP